MFRGRVDVSAEVKLIDLPEGDDVDPVNVTAAHLRRNMKINVDTTLDSWKKMWTVNKAL